VFIYLFLSHLGWSIYLKCYSIASDVPKKNNDLWSGFSDQRVWETCEIYL